MDVRIADVSYMVDNRPRSLLGYVLQGILGDKNSIFKLSDEDAVMVDGINLQVKQGGVTVFTGLGLGHKCLIECIALRQREGLMKGKMHYDGTVRENGMFKDIALIVDLGVNHFSSLTVFEYLFYGTRLRISHDAIECRERARQAARLVGLDGTRLVGVLGKAELRILDIAAEIVSNPTLICLIDPIEGLDAGSKVEVMKVLKTIASRVASPTTIIYSVSSIDSDTHSFVDEVAVFSGKHLEYIVPIEKLVELGLPRMTQWLAHLSLVVIDHVHQADGGNTITAEHYQTLMKVIDQALQMQAQLGVTGAGSTARGKRALTADSSRRTAFFSAQRRTGEAGSPVRYRKTLVKELSILMTRSLKYHYKNALYLRMSLYRFSIAALLLGGLAYSHGNTMIDNPNLLTSDHGQTDIYAYNVTAVAYVFIPLSLLSMAFTLPYTYANVKLLQSEVSSGLQGSVASWLSLLLTDVPIYLLIALTASMCVYYIVELQGSVSSFLGSVILTIFIAYSLSLNCAVWARSISACTSLYAAVALFFMVFNGYIVYIDNLPSLWYWTSTVSYSRYAFQAIMRVAFDEAEDGEAYLASFSLDTHSMSTCLLILVLWLALLNALVLVGLLPQWLMYKNVFIYLLGELAPGGHPGVESAVAHEDYVAMEDGGKLRASSSSAGLTAYSSSVVQSVMHSSPHVAPDVANDLPEELQRSPDSFSMAFQPPIHPKIVFLPRARAVSLTYQRVSYRQEVRSSEAGADTRYADTVLDNITGCALPGRLCCILNGSGEDRTSTTLLQVLAGVIPMDAHPAGAGQASGTVCANGLRISHQRVYTNAVYVPRGDVLDIAGFTVREVLTFAALLRRTDVHSCSGLTDLCTRRLTQPPGGIQDHERAGRSGDIAIRVHEVLDMLGLDGVADRLVGRVAEMRSPSSAIRARSDKASSVARHLTSYSHRLWQHIKQAARASGRGEETGITPAQLRLLTIGTELVNRPALVFLEDPFFQLEPHESDVVATILRSLAEGNRTVIASMERPVFRVVAHCHDLVLLSQGMSIYSGAASGAVDYFTNIGFHRTNEVSDLDYLLDICNGRGKMTMAQGKRAAGLTSEDLADLSRSLASIKAGSGADVLNPQMLASASEEDGSLVYSSASSNVSQPSEASGVSSQLSGGPRPKADYYYAMDDDLMPPPSPRKAPVTPVDNAKDRFRAVSRHVHAPPTGPTAWVLLHRGLTILSRDRVALAKYLLQCLAAGLMLGSMFFQLGDGDVQARLSLFACVYMVANLQIVQALEGIYQRKMTFQRESRGRASNYLSYCLMDPAAPTALFAAGSLLLLALTYGLSGLRPGGGPFFGLFVLLLASVYCNLALAYALSIAVPSAWLSKMLFTGVLLPLQLVMSGFLVSIPTMQAWSLWGAYVCPLTYFLGGALRNECSGNVDCTGTLSFGDIEDHYGYHSSVGVCVLLLVVMALVHKSLHMVLLYAQQTLRPAVVRRKLGQWRRQVVQAGLRWRSGPTSRFQDADDELIGEMDFE